MTSGGRHSTFTPESGFNTRTPYQKTVVTVGMISSLGQKSTLLQRVVIFQGLERLPSKWRIRSAFLSTLSVLHS